jgi:hypothetical protein
MNKDFFDNIDQRRTGFASRSEGSDEIGIEITLANGRTFDVQTIVETADAWVQIDGRDAADPDEKLVSFVVPYFQINVVQFGQQRARRHAGFGR